MQLETTPDALALACVLKQPFQPMVLSGAATVEQLRQNFAALQLLEQLPDGVVEAAAGGVQAATRAVLGGAGQAGMELTQDCMIYQPHCTLSNTFRTSGVARQKAHHCPIARPKVTLVPTQAALQLQQPAASSRQTLQPVVQAAACQTGLH